MTLAPGHQFSDDAAVMQYAIDLAKRGIGFVEPNPAVGAVVVDHQLRLIGCGFHQRFGGPHAEVNAIADCNGDTKGHSIFVTLEPCSHHGKTPPCAEAVIAAGLARVVIGCADPAPHTSLNGIKTLQQANIDVTCGVCEKEAQNLIAPFTMLQTQGRPWVHAKWAMTLDGKIASRTGHSRWISNDASRAVVHQLRGRMDAIITGAGTARIDDPLLTARPAGSRTPVRVVVDSSGSSITPQSQLVRTLHEAPVMLCVRRQSMDVEHCSGLEQLGVEILTTDGSTDDQLHQLLKELGSRNATNVLLEAGSGLIGQFFDSQVVDEVHAFIAAKILGSAVAKTPVGGGGLELVPEADSLKNVVVTTLETNILIEGHVDRA